MDTTEARPILAAAEAAAAISDYATAERLLRDAATVQERTLGSAHPELANTFNNLGVVCERAGKIDEAEASYRRAYAIVTSAFPADHPFVATSRQNLEEFCAANGRSIDSPASAIDPSVGQADPGPIEQMDAGPQEQDPAYTEGPAYTAPSPATEADQSQESAQAPVPMRLRLDTPMPVDAGPKEQGPAYVAPARAAEPIHTAERVPVTQRVAERSSSALPLGALAVLVITFVIVFVGLMAWSSRTSDDAPDGNEPSTTTDPRRPDSTAAPPPADTSAAAPAAASPRATPSQPPAVAPSRETSAVSSGGITVSEARLCRTLATRGQWECAPLGDPAAPGTMFFYTRIVSASPTNVEHRWYFGDRLEQSVTLDVQPNNGGYRTFSRRTSNARLAGSWRVELRSEDGQLLREERFTVSR